MMLLKAAGVIMIIAGSGVWGLSGAKRLTRRQEQLAELKMAVAFLDKEISFMHNSLSQAMHNTAGFTRWPVSVLFAAAAAELNHKKGVTAAEAWMRGLQAVREEAQLKPQDIDLLATLAAQLGVSSAPEQNKALSALAEELGLQEQKARQELDANQKLWSYGGFIMGTAVVLLLI